MSANQTICGKLVTLLKEYAAASGERQYGLFQSMEEKVSINRQEFFDGRSLWRRNVKSRRTSAEPLQVSDDSKLSESEAKQLIETMRSDFSLQHMNHFMNTLLGEKESVSTGDMELQDDREFIMLILSAIRAGERHTGFKAQVGSENFMVSGYRVPDMTFIKAGGKNKRVE